MSISSSGALATTASGLQLEKTAKRLKHFFQRRLLEADSDITIDQWVVLQEIDRLALPSQRELAEATDKDAPTLTRILDLLQDKRLVERQADRSDRRRFRLRLTRLGKQKIVATLPIVEAARSRAWQGLSEDDLTRFSTMLEQITNNLID